MKIIKTLENKEKNPTAVALGFFDGVHLGHQKVISQAVEAKKSGLVPTVFTFSDMPSSKIKDRSPGLLTTNSEKEIIMESLGIEVMYEIDFDVIRDMSAQDFVEKILVEKLNTKKVFFGKNYHFGKNAQGDYSFLLENCPKYGIEPVVVPAEILDGQPVSSTRIRTAIRNGDVFYASKLLGRYFGVSQVIVAGNKIGRRMGTPTINQQVPPGGVLPKFGVYASAVTVKGKTYCGVTNVGVKPTVGSKVPLYETWIIDFSGDIYGEKATTLLLDFVRPEKKFEGLSELKAEIFKNGIQAQKIFKEIFGYRKSNKITGINNSKIL